jgi:predicted amidohydrolase YtcJ/beta-lactamase class A
MKRCLSVLVVLASVLSTMARVRANETPRPTPVAWSAIGADPAMQRVIERARDAVAAKYADAGLTPDHLAVTVVDLTDRSAPKRASWRGDQMIYPASVVKLFYLGMVERMLEDGKLKETPYLKAAVTDMIVDSLNDATHYVVDAVSGVTGGPELSDEELKAWGEKRSVVNRYFESLGYTGVNAVQKTWCEGPYGRESQWVGEKRERRNKVTTEAVARLVYEVATGQFVTPARSRAMLDLMHRDPRRHEGTFDEQAHNGVGEILPPGSEYYSKAGWTSSVLHDSAYIRLPNGAEYVVVVFTDNGNNGSTTVPFVGSFVPFVGRFVMEEMLKRGRPADTVYRNGKIWTGNSDAPWASAMAVGGETLLAVGGDDDVKPVIGPATKVVDLGGRFVAPGFVDDHTHFIWRGQEILSVDVHGTKTPEEFARRLADYAAKLPEGRWIEGSGWDHEAWPDGKLPTRQLVDPGTPRNPVFLLRTDGHMGIANSAALKVAGITKDTASPAGGEIVKDPATGEPTGVLKDAAMELVNKAIPEKSAAEVDAALDAAMAEAGRNGVTSIQDITSWQGYDAYTRARDAKRLTVRVYSRTPLAEWERQAKIVAEKGPGDQWLRLGGFKAFMDGSLGSTTAYFFEPYLDAPNSVGLLSDEMADPKAFLARVQSADAAGLQVSVHAIGDRANAMLLDIFERVALNNGPRDRRFRIEHAQHLRAADIGRMARDRVIASVQPYHAIDDGRWAAKRLDAKRLAGTYAFRSLLDAGAPVAFGSDAPVAPISPLLGIYAAVTRRTLDDKNPNGWIPEQKVTVEEALRAYTSGCAYASFEESVKGRLAAGYLADFVVLSDDLFAIDPVRIREVQVLRTVVGGEEVFVHGPHERAPTGDRP